MFLVLGAVVLYFNLLPFSPGLLNCGTLTFRIPPLQLQPHTFQEQDQ